MASNLNQSARNKQSGVKIMHPSHYKPYFDKVDLIIKYLKRRFFQLRAIDDALFKFEELKIHLRTMTI